jgi:hypothetical protein
MNDKCSELKIGGNAPLNEIGTCWYECALDIEDVKNCVHGISIDDFKKEKKGFTIKDSGKRKEFSTGMIRDSEDKIRYDLIPIWFLERFAEHLTKGARKYKPRNWELAETEEELDRFIQSLCRHIIAYLKGDIDEDHMSAICFNLCGIELVKEKLGDDWQSKLKEYQLGKSDKNV